MTGCEKPIRSNWRRFWKKSIAQTIALVLAHLEPQHASPILSKLPSELQIDVVKRIAQLQNFSPEAAETISKVLNQKT